MEEQKPIAADLLTGQVAVVTGGSSGNGRAICLSLARHGARAIINASIESMPREGGEDTVTLLREMGVEAEYVQCDVRNPDDLERAIKAADAFGGVSIMVNNAGIITMHSVFETTPEVFDNYMAVNVAGVFHGSRLAAQSMIEHGINGSIVNISSNGGIRGASGTVAYGASKGAVNTMSYALAGAFGEYGIRVNLVQPGPAETSMWKEDVGGMASPPGIPLGRIAKPQEIGEAVAFLSSEMASYVTGASLLVDGGQTNTFHDDVLAPKN